MIADAVNKLYKGIFPPDTIKLRGSDQYRTRVGNWRIKFSFNQDTLQINSIDRRNEKTYKP